jgi:hypothetical protein
MRTYDLHGAAKRNEPPPAGSRAWSEEIHFLLQQQPITPNVVCHYGIRIAAAFQLQRIQVTVVAYRPSARLPETNERQTFGNIPSAGSVIPARPV